MIVPTHTRPALRPVGGVAALLATAFVAAPAHGAAIQTDAAADSVWVAGGVAVRMHDGPDRRVEWELFVPASVDAVWRAWTAPQEMVKWAGPAAEVDLRPGGTWEVHFNPERPAGQRGSDANRIVSIVAHRELHIEAGAPLDFPTVRAEKTDFVVRLEPAGFGHTRVVAVQSGWKDGEEWDRAFRYLAGANAEWLGWLEQRFVHGPLEWPSGP